MNNGYDHFVNNNNDT